MRNTAKNEKTSLGSQLSTEHSYPEGRASRDFLLALPGNANREGVQERCGMNSNPS
jgi:hypothetical protein